MARAAQAPLQSQAAPTPALLSIPPPTLSLPHRVFSCVPLTALYPVSCPKIHVPRGAESTEADFKKFGFFQQSCKESDTVTRIQDLEPQIKMVVVLPF